MKVNLYAVYDLKALAYSAPFVAANDEVAKRMFATTMEDPTTMIGRYPKDYRLFCLGDFDDYTGTIVQEVRLILDGQGQLTLADAAVLSFQAAK